MDVRALRYSLAIAQFGSFTKAAESLHVAQPALSVSVKKLESELGVTLFARNAHRVEPTVEGKILLQRAKRIFAEMDSAINEIADAVELRSGAIRVGMPPMYGESCVRRLCNEDGTTRVRSPPDAPVGDRSLTTTPA